MHSIRNLLFNLKMNIAIKNFACIVQSEIHY